MTLNEEDVDLRLKRWARHVAGELRGGFLGLPGRCTYLELAIKSTGSLDKVVPEEVWETDRAIRALDEINPHLRTVVEVSYLAPGDRAAHCKMMEVSERTRDRWVSRAIQHLIVILSARK